MKLFRNNSELQNEKLANGLGLGQSKMAAQVVRELNEEGPKFKTTKNAHFTYVKLFHVYITRKRPKLPLFLNKTNKYAQSQYANRNDATRRWRRVVVSAG